MPGRWHFVVLLLLSLPGACSRDEGASAAGISIRDSSGVRIVESLPGQEVERWVLREPRIDFGHAGGDVDFHHVVGALRLADGRVVVGNAGSYELLVFDGSGRLRGRLGREGDGPGEYRSLAWIARIGGDTLITYDEGLRRLSTLTTAGAITGSATPEPTSDAFFPEFVGAFGEGTLLGKIGEPFPDELASEVRYRDSLTLLRYDRDGHLLGTLGRFPNREAFVVRSGTGDLAWSEIPYGRMTVLAVDSATFHVTTGDAYEIQTFDRAGELRRIVRARRERPEVTAADRRVFLERRRGRLSGIDDPTRRQLHEDLLDRIPFPERHAGYADIVVTERGDLWAKRDEATWDVFAVDGRLLGEARLPSDVVVFEIGEDYVLGLRRDELEVEHVVLDRLVRGAAPRNKKPG